MELTTVPTVVHAHMLPSWGAEVLTMAIVIAAIAMYVPGMSATIGGIEVGTSEVEVVTVRIAGIDAEVPVACLPVDAKHVRATRHTHQIVEIDFITSLILLVGEVELVCHFICQEQSLVAGLLKTHGGGRDCDCQHRHQGHQHLFHNRIF